jgi:DNA-directed RNA polymerase subunit E"
MAVKKACKNCRLIHESEKCPACQSELATEKFSSTVVITNPEKSKVAEKMGIKAPGDYAVRVGK